MSPREDPIRHLQQAWSASARKIARGSPTAAGWRTLGDLLANLEAPGSSGSPDKDGLDQEDAPTLEQLLEWLSVWPEHLRRAELVDTEGQQEEPEDQGWTAITFDRAHEGWLSLVRFLRSTAERIIEQPTDGGWARHAFTAATRWELLGPSDPMWFAPALGMLPRVRALRLDAEGLRASRWPFDHHAAGEALCSEEMAQIEELDLGGFPVAAELGARMVKGPLGRSLRVLDLARSLAESSTWTWLLRWPQPSPLAQVSLYGNRIVDRDAMALFESPLAQRLVVVDLRSNSLTDDFGRRLRRRAFPSSLRRLYLHGNSLSGVELAKIAAWGSHAPGFAGSLDQAVV